jgi:hypothetical protein
MYTDNANRDLIAGVSILDRSWEFTSSFCLLTNKEPTGGSVHYQEKMSLCPQTFFDLKGQESNTNTRDNAPMM